MKSIFSIFLAFQVLLGSLNISGGLHFCGGELKSIGLFGKAESCSDKNPDEPDEMILCSFHRSIGQTLETKSCCEDRLYSIQALSDIKLDVTKTVVNIQKIIFDFVSFDNKSFLFDFTKNVVSFFHYKPPLVQQNLLVLLDRFLI